MGKLSRGIRGSSVPASGLGAAAEFLTTLSGITGAVGEVLSTEAKAEALKLRATLEATQAIVNESEAGVRSVKFEETAIFTSTRLKQQFADSPQRAVDAFSEEMRSTAALMVNDAPNSQVGLALTKSSNAKIAAGMREMAGWALARQNQKVKIDLKTRTNQATAVAENLGSLSELSALITAKDAELSQGFTNVHGAKAGDRKAEMFSAMSEAFVIRNIDRDPLAMGAALDASSGPLVDHLTGKQRASLRSKVRAGFSGFGKRAEMRVIWEGAGRNGKLYESYLNGTLDGGVLFSEARKFNNQRAAIQVDPSFDENQKAQQTRWVDQNIQFVEALSDVYRRGMPFDADDDIGTLTTLLQKQEDLFPKKGGEKSKDLGMLLEQQVRVAVAFKDKKISGSTYNTLMRAIAIALPKGISAEKENTGPFFEFWMFQATPQQVGNKELNNRFENNRTFSTLPDETKARIRIRYMQSFNASSRDGAVVSEEQARKLAIKALSVETGRFG